MNPVDGDAHNGRAFGGSRGVLAQAQAWRAQGTSFSLAIVIDTEGSTYRKPGAFAVISANCERCGVLSGGCLEPGVDALGLHALETASPQCAEFDTRSDEDLVFGSGSGCRGRMRVVAIPVLGEQSAPLWQAIVDASQAGETLRVAMVAEGPQTGVAVAWDPLGRVVSADAPNRAESLAGLREAGPGRHRCAIQGIESDVAVFDVRPPIRLLLFGAGPEARPLLHFAQALGWITFLVDHRQALLDASHGRADRVLLARPAAAAVALDSMRFDAAVAMTHVASTDLDALGFMSGRDIAYVGLLGPTSRRDGLLAQHGGDARRLLEGRLHAPVGLDLGGEGPEIIALSIVAQIQRQLGQAG